MATTFLGRHPDLRPFLLSNAQSTGKTIALRSYGSVEEVTIPGASCAAKKIHDVLLRDSSSFTAGGREQGERASEEFVRSCLLISRLRHPHLVLFLGVCFLPGSRLPAIVTEKLLTSLHDVLSPDPPPPKPSHIPADLKCSVLHDVASGLSFLHSHTPPVTHGSLSATNVFVTDAMVAKIGDIEMSQILSSSTPTLVLGTSAYQPPEAMEGESRNNDAMFNIGPNCPGISGTVTDFFAPSRIPDSFIIDPEVEHRLPIKPLVAQVLALLAVYGGIIPLAACPAHLSQAILWLALQPLARNGNPQDASDNVYVKWVWLVGVA